MNSIFGINLDNHKHTIHIIRFMTWYE